MTRSGELDAQLTVMWCTSERFGWFGAADTLPDPRNARVVTAAAIALQDTHRGGP